MMHPSIHFSHAYRKLQVALQGTDKATLLDVIKVDIALLSRPFLDYDTDDGTYTLSKAGDYLMLIFLGQHGIFTTLRSVHATHRPFGSTGLPNTASKEQWYRSQIGKEFQINYPTQ